jgi:hypothetical protein
MDATHLFFTQSVARVKQTIHMVVPPFIAKTIVRWLINDPEYQVQFLRYMCRAIDPTDFKTTPRMLLRMLVNGIKGDIRQRFKAK